MINKSKILPLIVLCGILFSSSYYIVNATNRFESEFLFSENSLQTNKSSATTQDTTTTRFPISKAGHNSYEDLNESSPMDAPMPENVRSVVEYDVKTGNYVLRTFVGDLEISTPYSMNEQEYRNYSEKQATQRYWKEKNKNLEASNEDKFSLTDMKFDIGPADKLFGPGGVQLRTQGSAELIFGVRRNKIDNPALTETARKSTIFEFDEKIQLNVNAQVGTRVNFGLNYNTEASFDFDQKMAKLGFKGEEDDIIQNIEAGNVSMQLNSSLIQGSNALFGLRTDLKFGKLNVSAVVSQQKSESKRVSSKGGTQTTEFDIPIDSYDENRHFFLAHYFRDHFESSMNKLPSISSGVTIGRVELWITNKRANYDQARNILAFMDLAENDTINNKTEWNSIGSAKIPSNNANNLYEKVIAVDGIRNPQETNQLISTNFPTLFGGEDFDKIESARKLDPNDYIVNNALGFISLRTALNPDEVLAVAFEYTYGGNTYQVGEFSTDKGIESNQALIVKLLKSTTQAPNLPIWKLMMKNVYSLGAMQLQEENFKLDIIYRNDSIGTNLKYITEGDIKNQLLLRVMGLDRLDTRQELNPDGIFDYIQGYTVLASTGRIIFPVLEPFGKHLRKKINNDLIADKYVFEELYDSTLVFAREFTEKNKFRLIGEYKASSGSEIRLNAMNIPRGSVTVTSGGHKLIENQDYTVDYTMGTVTIINQSYVESGNNIDVQLENQSLFNMQRKTLLGTHLEYSFSDNFSLGGTIMHLSEKPLTTKVNTGSEPLSNTIWGLNTAWRKESQWLTNVLDMLPFVNATQPSSIAFNAEFAQLIPGHSKVIGESGYAYIDDFETTKTNIDIHYPLYWSLASTPSSSKFKAEAQKSNDLDYGRNRALISWYSVDPILNGDSRNTPQHLRENPDLQSNHFTRNVLIDEVFPNRDHSITETSRQLVMNLSYYPSERGPYNLNANALLPDGKLSNPEARWGGIMRKLDVTDFETSNIEYIEFWMMDPFINDTDNTFEGGDLYFNLGDISEDILKDGKKFFEHGLNPDGSTDNLDQTVWGYVPKIQSTVRAFDNTTAGARKNQDVGLNGLSTDQEYIFPSYKEYLDSLEAQLPPTLVTQMKNDPFSPFNDPAGDNYHYYRGSYYDQQKADILTRYKYFNGTEGNSADANDNEDNLPTAISSLPDMEDINNDNTLNEYENYYEYRVSIRKDSMVVGKNFITEKAVRDVKLKNGQDAKVTWYQFKIPIRDHNEASVGNINGFKSIRFIRMYMTNFKQEAHLRFATMDLVRGEWRKYTKALDYNIAPSGTLDVLAVNVEENSKKEPVNYILPPGISRQTDPGQPQLLQQNEQSMVLRANNLAPKEALAVYKKTYYDMRQYKRLQMFVHAEALIDDPTELADDDLTVFIRLGTDMVNNYYEYEIPLKLTPHGEYSSTSLPDRQAVWPIQNMFDFPFSKLTQTKLQRNRNKETDNSGVNNLTVFTIPDPDNPSNSISVLGNPTLSEVNAIMIGVRNGSNRVKSGEIWVNELRMSEFDEDGGWAALANLSVGLSDIGSLSFAGRIETAGFGGIESNILDRRLDNLYQMNFATSLDLGRFLPEKAKLQIPTYFSYSNETIRPKYSPTDGDITLDDALDNLGENQSAKDSLLMLSQTISTTKSFNISNARVNIKSKEPRFYDPANISVTYVHNESNRQNAEIEQNLVKEQRVALNYSHSFNVKPWTPFKDKKSLSKPYLKIIQDFNINYMPSNISFNTNMSRNYTQTRLRNFDAHFSSDEPIRPENDPNLTYSKNFMWNRQFNIQYNPTQAIRLSLQTGTNANIEEGYLTPEIGKEYYEAWRDTVWTSIKGWGRPYAYQQVFTASWNVPINKLPFLDFITSSNATYNANYNWNRTAAVLNSNDELEEIGNSITSTRSIQLDGQFNMETLYNKSAYLKRVNQKYASTPQRRGSGTNQDQKKTKFEPKTYSATLDIKKGTPSTISHRLRSERIRFSAKDKNGNPITISYKVQNDNTLKINPKVDADSVTITIVSRDPNSGSNKIVDFTARTLMMVRRGSVNYRQSNSMILPGFFPEAGFMGQKSMNGTYAPGFDFAFGFFNDDTTMDKALRYNWLNNDTTFTNPVLTTETSDFEARLSLEPIPGLKIDLNAQRYTASNTSVLYMYNGHPSTYTGSFNATQVAFVSAFKKIGNANENFYSQTFETFKQNREIIVNRLNAQHAGNRYPNAGFISDSNWKDKPFDPSLGYDKNSSDVLIPAFLAAYTGRDPNKINTNPFLNILQLLPNWRASYDGLSRIPWIKDKFRTVSITHAYTCRYTIGSYTSYSTWVAMSDGNDALGYVRDVQTNNPMPSMPYDISSVSLIENFSPLIGINLAMKNNTTASLKYGKQRNLALNLTSLQLIEGHSDEFTVGFGYVVNNFDVVLRSKSKQQSNVKNDLKLNVDLSYKDMKSLLRKLDDEVTQASSGNQLFSIKIMADYVFSSKVNIQLFFDHQTTNPLISTTFPISTTNFGMSFKFMLTR